MNRKSFHLLFVLSLAALLASGGMANAQVPKAEVPGPRVKPTIPPVVKECRDPAAESLTFVILSHDAAHRTRGRIRLTGVVRNLGNAAFESNPNQAVARLSTVPTVGAPQVLRFQNIARLNPGASIQLSVDTAWDTAQEFAPKFVLSLDYDPDIGMDGNPKNDDCNMLNNRRELTADQINRQWR